MKVILREDVSNLGKSGDVVTVRDGYGRNFLLPQGLAVLATERNVKQIEHQRKIIAARNAKLARDAQAIADRLAAVEVVIPRHAGEADKLFGAVTTRDIEEALKAMGLTVDRRKIHLPDPIKALGDYSVDVKLGHGVSTKIKVRIIAQS